MKSVLNRIRVRVFAIFATVLMLGTLAVPAVSANATEMRDDIEQLTIPGRANATEIISIMRQSPIVEEYNSTNPINPIKCEDLKELLEELEGALLELEESGEELDYIQGEVFELVKDIDQDLRELRLEVEELEIDPAVRADLLINIDVALEKSNQALQFTLNGRAGNAIVILGDISDTLGVFVSEVGALNEEELAEEDADNLIQEAQEIIEEIEEEVEYVLDETGEIVKDIEENMVIIRGVIVELQAAGVEVEVIYEGGNPVFLIIVGGVVIHVIVGAAVSIAITFAIIEVLERHSGRSICCDCRARAYLISGVVGGAIGGTLKALLFSVSSGILTGLNIYFAPAVTSVGIILDILWGAFYPCDTPGCFFSNYAYHEDAIESINQAREAAIQKHLRVYEQTITDAPMMWEYRWFDQDFGWTHTIRPFGPMDKEIISATLYVTAWNVDWGVEPY